MLRPTLLVAALSVLTATTTFAERPSTLALQQITTELGDARELIYKHYFPPANIPDDFRKRFDPAYKAIRQAENIGDAYATAADLLASVDPRIRLYPGIKVNRIDYGWTYAIIGNDAYVVQLDQDGHARELGLKLGDRILALEGIALNRSSAQDLYYLINTLTPRTVLRVLAQSPNEEPRWLAIKSTVRPAWKHKADGTRDLSREEQRDYRDRRLAKNQIRTLGDIAIWRPEQLSYEPLIKDAMKLVAPSSSLIIDLRHTYLRDHQSALRLLSDLFTDRFSVGRIDRAVWDIDLTIAGHKNAFQGTVLILINYETSMHAEFIAHVLQARQRAVLIGDRTMGRVFHEGFFNAMRGDRRSSQVNVSQLAIPEGDFILDDGTILHGQGVPPDYQIFPTADDIANRRDPVLSKAVELLKGTLSPEEAYTLFPRYNERYDFL
jgi:C-terminal processing protease CtpA/Prc